MSYRRGFRQPKATLNGPKTKREPRSASKWATTLSVARTGLLACATGIVLGERARTGRQLIVAQSADDILDWKIDPGMSDVVAVRHVGGNERYSALAEIRLELMTER